MHAFMWKGLKNQGIQDQSPEVVKSKTKTVSQKFTKYIPGTHKENNNKKTQGRQFSSSKLMMNVRQKSQDCSYLSKKSADPQAKQVEDSLNISMHNKAKVIEKQSPLRLRNIQAQAIKKEIPEKLYRHELKKLQKNIRQMNTQFREIMKQIRKLVSVVCESLEQSYKELVNQLMTKTGKQNLDKKAFARSPNLQMTFGHEEIVKMNQRLGNVKSSLQKNLKVAQQKLLPLHINSEQSLGIIQGDSDNSPISSGIRHKEGLGIKKSNSSNVNFQAGRELISDVKADHIETMYQITETKDRSGRKSQKFMVPIYSDKKLSMRLQRENCNTQSKTSFTLSRKGRTIQQLKTFRETITKMKGLMQEPSKLT